MSKIILGMSGGVDSAVAAHLLKNKGHEVIGVFMRNWDSIANNDILGNPNANASVCPEEQDWNDVVALGKQIGIETKRVDFIKEYWENVFEDLIDNYEKGRTPNPDILCNKFVKFGAFAKWIEKEFPDFDYIATGHYAKVKDGIMSKPYDKWKDQTYFLSQVSKDVLKKTIFPLADLPKDKIRKIAKKNNLIVANKKDSTGICFIGERDFSKFLSNYIPAQKGEIVNIKNNETIGEHIGVMYYTIGQRKGINLSGMTEPYYVAGNDIKKRILYVAPKTEPQYLNSIKATIEEVNWFANKKESLNNIEVKFRYKSNPVKCSIKWIDETTIEVDYPSGFSAVTPGQQAVFYQGDLCLGGGIINKVFDEEGIKTYLNNN